MWLVGWLTLAVLFVVSAVSLVIASLGIAEEGETLAQTIWKMLNRTLDPGNMADDEGTALLLALTLGVSLFGIVIFSTLIGIIDTALGERIDVLRRGRTKVQETDHTVIIGWSSKIIAILRELVEHHEDNWHKSSVVIFANKDRTEMEETIESEVEGLKKIKYVCRRGQVGDPRIFEITNIQEAKNIIVLNDEKNGDINVVKHVLNLRKYKKDDLLTKTIIEINDKGLVPLVKNISENKSVVLSTQNFLTKLIAQTIEQSGLSLIYNEIFSFSGNKFYIVDRFDKKLLGQSYHQMQHEFPHACIVGFVKNGEVNLNPAGETLLEEGDKIILLAESKDQAKRLEHELKIDEKSIVSKEEPVESISNVLILGLNPRVQHIIRGLSKKYKKKLNVTILSKNEMGPRDRAALEEYADLTYDDLSPAVRGNLENIKFESFDKVMILKDDDAEDRDTEVIITLLNVRDLMSRLKKKPSITTEINNVSNKSLLDVASYEDFVISNQFISKMIAQIITHRSKEHIIRQITDINHTNISLLPVGNYIKKGQAYTFATLVESAARKGHTALGVQIAEERFDTQKNHGVHLNPDKSIETPFHTDDKAIVLV
ncbi:probable ion channel CASTOR [Stylophora pistillata]|uniref:probable ion channel CASTOR n=1 Tax=Stylophora pistillata TaxID=50429 RepID=UPI000C041911|nr:probable ion channel CASTOR [Stylophora pistillata]